VVGPMAIMLLNLGRKPYAERGSAA